MKKLIFSFLMLMASPVALAADKPVPPTSSTSSEMEPCLLQVEITEPKGKNDFPIQLCMYKHTEVRGIFGASACVIVLIETQSGTRHPFYGSKGHWGVEGDCDKDRVIKKFEEKDTLTTVNPISDLKSKRQHGYQVKILKDDLKVGDTLLNVSKVTQK